jgi:hypothetical protein
MPQGSIYLGGDRHKIAILPLIKKILPLPRDEKKS